MVFQEKTYCVLVVSSTESFGTFASAHGLLSCDIRQKFR